jgi:hypothetical protein
VRRRSDLADHVQNGVRVTGERSYVGLRLRESWPHERLWRRLHDQILRHGRCYRLRFAGRQGYSAAADELLGKADADALFAAEMRSFPGRLGIMHRDLPEMVARSYADVAFTWHHLVSYWARIFPNHFELVAVPGAERFFTQIAFGRVIDPLRPRALKAFDEFFFSRARDVYPEYRFRNHE